MSNRLAALVVLLLPLVWNPGNCSPYWIEHASRPGPDIPPAGQSRFDQLFAVDGDGYRIPYPFDRLIETLEGRLDNGNETAVRQVYLPIGRSLQREAAAPHYYRFPRRVIATEGEPVGEPGEAGLVMEYRLFIAHQPATETLEVISYNDSAGRFEFQVVENYSADSSPRVAMASRMMCLSCHQNAAPVFARMPWSETSFNVAVASRLVDALPHRFGSLIGTVTADAGIIDVLVERANYLSAAQLIWHQGCESSRCRAAMLRAMLQYRLSGESNFAHGAAGYRRDFVNELSRNWNLHWPAGLALPASRIEDRDPYATEPPRIELDPLFPRPPQASWERPDAALARGIVYRLAGFLTLADIRRIDRRLIDLGNQHPHGSERYRAACEVVGRNADGATLSCGDGARRDSLQARIELDFRQQRIASVRVQSLRAPGDTNLVQPDIAAFSQFDDRLELIPADSEAGLSQRLATGDRIESLVLRWNDSPLDVESILEIEISSEFDLVDKAIVRMLDGDALAGPVFAREPILRELMQALGMKPLAWFKMANLPVTANIPVAGRLGGALSLLQPYCGHCHDENRSNPPGFLNGADPGSSILQCAPRMLRRLLAWQRDFDIARSPMPPPASIEFSGITANDWPSSDHYRSLVASLENLALEHHGRPVITGWRETDYDSLPPCLVKISE